ncbi:hypothetical protein Q4485_08270 [Granulosicoccaceae sp. 1_MG-2023]|nr:hypothetical protein [Granulosicoccaceae sp. 1_MG-2023]
MKRLVLCLFLAAPPALADDALRYDPFSHTPPAPASDAETVQRTPLALRLRAVVVAGKRSMANIDGKLVKVGQQFEGYTLVAVEAKAVTLRKDGEEFVLKLAAQSQAG